MAEAKRVRVDWEAVEREYRTGLFTLRELATTFGCTHQAIDKAAKKHGWSQDLSRAVRHATAAKVRAATAAAEVAKKVDNAVDKVVDMVDEVSTVASRVLLSHQKWFDDAAVAAIVSREKLMALAEGVTDVREAAVVVSAIESHQRTVKGIVEGQRKVLQLDDEGDKPPGKTLSDTERATRLAAFMDRAQQRKSDEAHG